MHYINGQGSLDGLMFDDIPGACKSRRTQLTNSLGEIAPIAPRCVRGELPRDKRHLFGTSGQQGDVSKQTRNTRVL